MADLYDLKSADPDPYAPPCHSICLPKVYGTREEHETPRGHDIVLVWSPEVMQRYLVTSHATEYSVGMRSGAP